MFGPSVIRNKFRMQVDFKFISPLTLLGMVQRDIFDFSALEMTNMNDNEKLSV